MIINVPLMQQICVGLTALFVVSSCAYVMTNNNDDVFIGNYQSYMVPTATSSLAKECGVVFDSFESDRNVANRFKTNKYDAAIVSNAMHLYMANSGLLKEIDWKKLNVHGDSQAAINDAKGAKAIYSSNVNKFVGTNENYLKYGIPYFLSYMTFVYRGTEIAELSNSSKNKSWFEILEIISKEDRFKSRGIPRIGLIDDARTNFALSQLLLGNDNSLNQVGQSDTGMKPDVYDAAKLKKAFDMWTDSGLNRDNLGENFLFINSDSFLLSNMLAKRELMGAFIYSGDAAYTLQGGSESVEIPENDFHIASPDKSIYILDFLAISKNISPEKEERLYKIINRIFFDGFKGENMFEKVVKDVGNKGSDEGDAFKYMTANNFDYVFYTPTLKQMIDKMKSDEEVYVSTNSKYKDVMKKILMVDDDLSDSNIYYENQMSDKETSFMNYAYSEFKSNL